MTREKIAILTIAALTLIAVTAGASAFVTRSSIENKMDSQRTAQNAKPQAQKITWNEPRQQPQPAQAVQPQQPACDDGNIVGAAIGAVAGGVAGNQIGSGRGGPCHDRWRHRGRMARQRSHPDPERALPLNGI